MKLTLFLICILSVFSAQSMQLYEFRVDLLSRDVVPTEYTTYTQLIKNPLPYNVTYAAVPWTWLINNKKLNLLPVKTVRCHNGFTICQHIYYERILPYLRTMGINVLFTPHASRTKTYNGVTVVPFPHYPVHTGPPAKQKDLLYSFVGAQTHIVRKKFFQQKHPAHTIVKKRNGWHFWTNKKQQEESKRSYIDALQRSRFAPCLRGTGSSTIRFWEALGAGAIPILLSDDMALPQEVDWSRCIIRVPEKLVGSIVHYIEALSPSQEARMRQECIQIFSLFSGDNFTHTIRSYFDTLYKDI